MIPIQLRRTLFRTRIKFCGMTRAGDVRLASELGADAVGFVFAEGSPRRVEAREARLMQRPIWRHRAVWTGAALACAGPASSSYRCMVCSR